MSDEALATHVANTRKMLCRAMVFVAKTTQEHRVEKEKKNY